MIGVRPWFDRARNQLGIPIVGQIFGISLVLMAIGAIFIYSATSALAARDYGDSFYFVQEHFIRILLAIIIGLTISAFDYHHFERISKWAFATSLVTLALMLVLPESVVPRVNGARRWLDLPGLPRIQPSEIARIAVLVYLAAFISRKSELITDFRQGVLPAMIAGFSVALVVLAGRDLGSALTLGTLVWALLWLGGARHRHMAASATVLLSLTAAAIYFSPYRWSRWLAHLRGDADPLGAGYHAKQSLISLANGGWFGRGIGQSWQKYFYLPEAHTDFVFAIVGEEVGVIGASVVLSFYGGLAWLCIRAARDAPDLFGRMLALGAALSLVLNTFLHAAVVSVLIPPTGIPMPLFSYGGTSLAATMLSLGIVMSVAARGKVARAPARNRRQG
ncbi:MAG: hypothetical protein CME06_16545 [Gemmatimonadetes bacterium]|nr:hypothetical protein [Gemmatimonadota bacterium]